MSGKRLAAVVAVSGMLLSGCQQAYGPYGGGYGGAGQLPYGGLSKQNMGTALGGALGGLGGSQVGNGNGKLAAVAAGTLFGALLGNQIGVSLDRADQMAAENGMDKALDYNVPVRWDGQNATGTVTPTRTGHARDGSVCREYQHMIIIGGKKRTGVGMACQQSDGSWRIAQ